MHRSQANLSTGSWYDVSSRSQYDAIPTTGWGSLPPTCRRCLPSSSWTTLPTQLWHHACWHCIPTSTATLPTERSKWVYLSLWTDWLFEVWLSAVFKASQTKQNSCQSILQANYIMIVNRTKFSTVHCCLVWLVWVLVRCKKPYWIFNKVIQNTKNTKNCFIYEHLGKFLAPTTPCRNKDFLSKCTAFTLIHFIFLCFNL